MGGGGDWCHCSHCVPESLEILFTRFANLRQAILKQPPLRRALVIGRSRSVSFAWALEGDGGDDSEEEREEDDDDDEDDHDDDNDDVEDDDDADDDDRIEYQVFDFLLWEVL